MVAEASFTLRAIDATKQAFASVQNSLSGLQRTSQSVGLAINSFLGFKAIINSFYQLQSAIQYSEENAVKFGYSIEKLSRLTRASNLFDKGWDLVKNTFSGLASELLFVLDAWRGISSKESISIADKIIAERDADKIKALKESMRDLNDQIRLVGATASAQLASPLQNISRLRMEIEKSGKPKDSTENLERQNDILKNEKTALEISTKAYEDYNKAQKQVNETKENFRNSAASEIEQQKKLDNQLINVGTSIRQLQSALGGKLDNFDLSLATPKDIQMFTELTDKLKEYNSLLVKRKDFETDLKRIAKDAGNIIASGFEDAIFSGQKLSEVIKAIGMDLMRMIFQQTITAPLAKGISTAILGVRAMGGPVSANSPYVVGERGPELFVPHASGSIVSNSNMNQGGGSSGSSINVNYNIAAGVTRNELAPILEQERRRLKAEIPDMVRRGGAYRSAFA
jgi:hypothetical protein